MTVIDWNATPAPMTLARQPPASSSGRDAIVARLAGGCSCGSTVAELRRRRTIRGVDIVGLQCVGCGGTIGGALKRDQHPDFLELPAWDEDLPRDYAARRQEEAQAALASVRSGFSREARAAQRREYSDWLLRSPDWRELRARVMARARHRCEACLEAPAAEVHHATYELGRLPPAWLLRAVCVSCHRRIHAAGDAWTAAL